MAERDQKQDEPVLTPDEERRLGEVLRKTLISDRPNPAREGCPDPRTLRDLAFHRRIGDPTVFERVTGHMAKCSACVRDALGYAEEYAEYRKKRRTAGFVFGVAAVLVVSLGAWVFWRIEQSARSPQVAGVVAPVGTAAPELAEPERVSIELPPRLRGQAPTAAIVLPRGRLMLDVRLPAGSPEGRYKFRIEDIEGKVRKEAEASASTAQAVTKVSFAIDTSDLLPETYVLSVLEPDLDTWVGYPLKVK